MKALHSYSPILPSIAALLIFVGCEGGSRDESRTASPTAAFTASPTSGSAPLSVAFTDASTGSIASWLWDFGDGATSTSQNPSHTYSDPGTYTVTLTVSGGGSSDSTSISITVNDSIMSPANTVVFTWEAPTTNEDGTELTDLAGYMLYCGPSSGAYTHVYDIGKVNIFIVQDLEPGTYYCVVTAYDRNDNESENSDEITMTIDTIK